MAKKSTSKYLLIDNIRKALNEANISIDFEDKGDYINMRIELDNYKMLAYQRNRRSGFREYDPLSKYKEILYSYLEKDIANYIQKPLEGYITINIEKYIEIPNNFTKKQRKYALDKILLPDIKPDNDNTEKIIYDIFNKRVYNDDAQIIKNSTEKFYGEKNKTIINIKGYKEKLIVRGRL